MTNRGASWNSPTVSVQPSMSRTAPTSTNRGASWNSPTMSVPPSMTRTAPISTNWIQWQAALFSDRSRSNLQHLDGGGPVWRGQGERLAQHDRFAGGSTHVWGGICFHHRTPPHSILGPANTQTYVNDGLHAIISFPELRHHRSHVFQHDSARAYTARATEQLSQEEDMTLVRTNVIL